MKKTLTIDDGLFAEAKAASGAATDSETLQLALEALVRHVTCQNLQSFRGAEPDARDAPRRREKPPVKRRVA
ncbi:MAG TPA: type II toxin-antitoxin system VapB family antitoxin [Bryobacteraceae bacterium]|nr:type II toxin-antitoxin system VapB family antitoxin [Bryobacteraceae bacterium]